MASIYDGIDPEYAAQAAAELRADAESDEKAQQLTAGSLGLAVEADPSALLGAMLAPAFELIARQDPETDVQLAMALMAIGELGYKVVTKDTNLPDSYKEYVAAREQYIFFKEASKGISEL